MIHDTDIINQGTQAVQAGRNAEFEAALKAHDIDAIRDKMYDRHELVEEARREYDPRTHAVNDRQDKYVADKHGNIIRTERAWKLPIPYPQYINEIALVFIYGEPVKWTQQSDGTDDAFQAFQRVIKSTRFDSKIRQAKRLAGAETESAMLFRVYRNDEGRPDVQIRVLARSKGDEIYSRFDQYDNLLTVAWGYYTREAGDDILYHYDIFTPQTTYHCARRDDKWEVAEEPNPVGKIPVILFQQPKEWAGVEPLIEREEYIASRTADTNDYFADPVMMLSADSIRNMPEKREAAKTLITNGTTAAGAASYLTWDSAPQSKKDELEWLQNQILQKTFTPNISLDSLKSLGNLSGKALRTVMLLADIKANRHKEQHDELLDRTVSLITAIIGRVLDIKLAKQCDKLIVGHEFANPFGEDEQADIANIISMLDGGIISQETAIEMNPLVKDASREKERMVAGMAGADTVADEQPESRTDEEMMN